MVKTVYFDHRHVHMTSWHMSRDSVKMMSHMPKCVSHPEYQIRWGDFRRWNHQKSYRGKTPGGVVPTPLGVRGLKIFFVTVTLLATITIIYSSFFSWPAVNISLYLIEWNLSVIINNSKRLQLTVTVNRNNIGLVLIQSHMQYIRNTISFSLLNETK